MLCGGQVAKIPRIAAKVYVFGVTTNSNSLASTLAGVDGIDGTERISDNFVVGQSTIGAPKDVSTWMRSGKFVLTVGR